MQCYAELTPPTAVTHSVSLPFVSAQSNNLVVAKSSLLQIFETKNIVAEIDDAQASNAQSTKPASQYDSRLNDDEGLESSFLGGDAVLVRSDRSNTTKLVLVAQFPLSGTVTGLARIKTLNTESGGEALLLLFKDAKLSLVEWDPERRGLSTISIHYYEQDELQGSPWAPALNDCVNFLAADPGSRCAALKFGTRNLAILPFKQPDEDIDMGDWDEELDGPRPVKDQSTAIVNGTSNIEETTPYSPSFVLRLSNLDPSLIHPVHLAFLYEYREPTFGILSSTMSPSPALNRRDHLSYMVFTLDLQQKASTTILSVGGLPQDLFQVVALPAPVGGALLVGTNELIHVDQSGKSNGVAVNHFTKQCTSFGLADQSDLDLRLEGCSVDLLSPETGEMLIMLLDGRIALLSFQIDGRTVSGLHLKVVTGDCGGTIVPSSVSTLSRLGKNVIFAGSEDGDSYVFGWTRKQTQQSRRKPRSAEAPVDFDNDDEELEDSDDDDLYGDAPTVARIADSTGASAKGGDLVFRIHDTLTSIAPIRDIVYGKAAFLPGSEEEKNSMDVRSDLQIACAVGRGGSGSIAVMNRQIQPKIIGRFEFPEARGLWTMSAQKPIPKSLQGDKWGNTVGNDYSASAQYDKFMIVAKVDLDGYETSDIYALTAAGFETLTGTEFEPAAGFTVEAGTMGNHKRIIQVLKSEVRCYDGDLGLNQILPMLDEETGAEPRVTSASISDSFILLIRDDLSAFIAQMDSSCELEELEKVDEKLSSTKWITGCLYTDIYGSFTVTHNDKGTKVDENILMFLLSSAGALYIYALPDLSKPVYIAEGLCYIPPVLSAEFAARRGTARDTITEILVADLGDAVSKSPYLILRHSSDDLTFYEPLQYSAGGSGDLTKSLRFLKLANPAFAKSAEEVVQDDSSGDARHFPLRVCRNVGGYSTVFLPGPSASFVIRSSKSTPHVIGLQGSGVTAMTSFHTEGCERGFVYADSEGIARVTQLPEDHSFSETGMSLKKVPLGVDINGIAYHPPMKVYALGCSVFEPFELPKDDDYHKEWVKESLTFKPMVERGVLKLVTPINWTVIDSQEMEPCETILCIKTLNLEVSEDTHERKQLIVVGTGISKGEDLPIKGRILVYDIVPVIPEPGKPETDRKLKLIVTEDIPRGAVTAISEVGSQGLMLVAQGQKCMVRGLKEDGTLLPVAFMDMNCYVTSLKEIPGTGLCLMTDAFKGVWFTGYTEEPYKMMLFGKSNTAMEVLNADFLPDGPELFLVAADTDGNLHILQFDPEHPKSLQGHLLIHRTSFCTGAHVVTKSLMLPRTKMPSLEEDEVNGTNGAAPALPPQILLLASVTGALSSLMPVSESSYRRLSSLASQLATSLPHVGGLNPKAYRLPPSATQVVAKMPPGVDAGVGRNIVDGALLARWAELSSGRRGEVAGRVGFGGPEEVRGELEMVLGWNGMEYF